MPTSRHPLRENHRELRQLRLARRTHRRRDLNPHALDGDSTLLKRKFHTAHYFSGLNYAVRGNKAFSAAGLSQMHLSLPSSHEFELHSAMSD
jgi:hypothetical protein